ncbi:hypothetical protein GCM10010250_18540 [Streptomyces althioticus]|nr:hypothetical protein GCM10010250_18540 [Streptomyces althioticus]
MLGAVGLAVVAAGPDCRGAGVRSVRRSGVRWRGRPAGGPGVTLRGGSDGGGPAVGSSRSEGSSLSARSGLWVPPSWRPDPTAGDRRPERQAARGPVAGPAGGRVGGDAPDARAGGPEGGPPALGVAGRQP